MEENTSEMRSQYLRIKNMNLAAGLDSVGSFHSIVQLLEHRKQMAIRYHLTNDPIAQNEIETYIESINNQIRQVLGV